jgi:hypothetical protein
MEETSKTYFATAAIAAYDSKNILFKMQKGDVVDTSKFSEELISNWIETGKIKLSEFSSLDDEHSYSTIKHKVLSIIDELKTCPQKDLVISDTQDLVLDVYGVVQSSESESANSENDLSKATSNFADLQEANLALSETVKSYEARIKEHANTIKELQSSHANTIKELQSSIKELTKNNKESNKKAKDQSN